MTSSAWLPIFLQVLGSDEFTTTKPGTEPCLPHGAHRKAHALQCRHPLAAGASTVAVTGFDCSVLRLPVLAGAGRSRFITCKPGIAVASRPTVPARWPMCPGLRCNGHVTGPA